jgi:hypothetical protein
LLFVTLDIDEAAHGRVVVMSARPGAHQAAS